MFLRYLELYCFPSFVCFVLCNSRAITEMHKCYLSVLHWLTKLGEDFIRFKSFSEAEISLSNLTLYKLFVDVKKKTGIFRMNFSFNRIESGL